MARLEANREDLLKEATGLVQRAELAPRNSSAANHVIVGFRSDGSLSVFFDGEPVYQFNAAGQLRRAYCNGLLFKAFRGRLVSLRRVRTQHQVQLLRHQLSDAEQTAFLSRMRSQLDELVKQLEGNTLRVVGQVPPDANVPRRASQWLAERASTEIARVPHVRVDT